MMHITEDTPPDMLAGAMDLTVHLPTNRSVKMSVERSTPMMDLLVHITSAHQLQLSNHIIQALEMAPSSERSDKVLPYKPNTPIGALDTQHIKVIAKNKPVSIPKNLPPGYQPFESTFRLQVHLPRNQLYVIRVSQHVFLENILKTVCDEKNLDMRKYELRHPGNLDEVLDLKLTLSDYKITEIYVVAKGTIGLAQTFSSSDIMALRKEEERKQMHAKTGGGVFNLIFKKGKSSTGSGSLSSENRSISPVHSDDSRSVTPPSVQPQLPKERVSHNERPKPPVRKRRPAPKPPQKTEISPNKPPSQVSTNSDPSTILDLQSKTMENGLTICHSRNSSDSSGYHEPSVLSENCNNTSLPRRPKSTVINVVGKERTDKDSRESQEEESGNLSKMAGHSKSLSSLVAGRKKRAAPAPPVLKTATSTANLEKVPPVDVTVAKNNVVEKPRPEPATPKISEYPSPVIASPTSVDKSESIASFNKRQTSVGSIESVQTPNESSLKNIEYTPKESESVAKITKSNLDETNNSISEIKNNKVINTIPQHFEKEIVVENEISINENKQLKSMKDTAIQSHSQIQQIDEVERKALVVEPKLPQSTLDIKDDQLETIRNETKSPFITAEVAEKPDELIIPKPPSEFLVPDNVDNENINPVVSELEIDWQYQLPPPPSAFRDDCSSSLADATNYDTVTLDGSKTIDSIVTQSELFEKAPKTHGISQMSDATSVQSEDEKHIYNKLSLENLEKRKSLVYNRELTTSLKMACDSDSDINREELNKNYQSQFEKKQPPIDVNMPNFKITTYDNPKKKINIFEDDSIRSSTEIITTKKNNMLEGNENQKDTLDTSNVLIKPENVQEPVAKHQFKKFNDGIFRSESFTTNNISSSTNNNNRYFRKPSNPVKRSRSQVALNRYREEQKEEGDNAELSRANSLYDVSGLQSLEVMRVIQNKLNLSNEHWNDRTQSKSESCNQDNQRPLSVQTPQSPPEPVESQPIRQNHQIDTDTPKPEPPKEPKKTYSYQGPPSICLSTWSERPKTQISLKEDTDYIVNNKNNINSLKNGTNNSSSRFSNVQTDTTFKSQRQQYGDLYNNNRGVNIKVNGTEISPGLKSSEVDDQGANKPRFNRNVSNTFINYNNRKPLGNVNEKAPRPHSIAFDSSFDISRVPIVRSVELKKDIQLINNSQPEPIGNDKYSDIYQSSESLNELNQLKNKRSTFYVGSNQPFVKPVTRINSFGPARQAPTVMGFRHPEPNPPPVEPKPKATNNYRTSQIYIQPREETSSSNFNVNKRHTIFGDVVLRKTSNFPHHSTAPVTTHRLSESEFGSRKMHNGKAEIKISTVPPPPPQLPKITSLTKKPTPTNMETNEDSRAELLDAIRAFGGKKNLRHVRA